jgi:hypothetical protein
MLPERVDDPFQSTTTVVVPFIIINCGSLALGRGPCGMWRGASIEVSLTITIPFCGRELKDLSMILTDMGPRRIEVVLSLVAKQGCYIFLEIYA